MAIKQATNQNKQKLPNSEAEAAYKGRVINTNERNEWIKAINTENIAIDNCPSKVNALCRLGAPKQ